MLGLMQERPLLISSLIEFAERHHGDGEIVSRRVEGDIHRYQCFERGDIDLDIHGHLHKAAGEWKEEADAIITGLGLPAICGEWSLGLDLKVVSLWAEGPFNHALERMDAFQQAVACRGYASAQLLTFEKYLGWFFWSYKTETTPAWSLRAAVERGWLPSRFA